MKAHLLSDKSVKQIEIVKVKGNVSFHYTDDVSVEEPLEIRVAYHVADKKETKNISVTMRTPGNDAELAAGFLFTEGIISGREQIKNIYSPQAECSRNSENVVIVELAEGFVPELMKADRNFYTTSSCGVCGKGSIESIRTVSTFHNHTKITQKFPWKLYISYPKNCSLSRIISVLLVVFMLPVFLIWKEIFWRCVKM